jgi:DNA-binding transcriptional LysR family regulator
MNLKFVEAFVWVARLRSITRAAEKLCLTQSAVSNRIAALEDELGAELINRRSPRFRLSDAGVRFMDYAGKLLMIQHEMLGEFGAPERQAFTLRIGAIESVLHTWLIPVVDHLKRSSPRIHFELTIETSLNLVEQIRRGALDIVFSALPAQERGKERGILNEALAPLEMVFIGATTLVSPLGLDELLRHDFMTFQSGSHPHANLLDALHAAGAGDKHVHAVSSISALALLAENGFGVATVPRQVAERLMRNHRVRILETNLPLAPLPLYASYWNTPARPVLDRTIREAVALARDCGTEGVAPSGAPSTLSAPGPSGRDALPAELSASPGGSSG